MALPLCVVVCERDTQAKRSDGTYARQVDIYADTETIESGVIDPTPYAGGSTLINTDTHEGLLLSEHQDGTKEWK